MCDYSLQLVRTRDAALHDELITSNFGTGTRGFACADDPKCAVCIKPGTEIAFDSPVEVYYDSNPIATFVERLLGVKEVAPTTAIFRQINVQHERMHHDALEFADGKIVLLTNLKEDQKARILQLPAAPKTKEEAKAQERVEFVG